MSELKQKRKKLGLTQCQVARACGVSRRTYQTYEESDIFNNTYYELIKKLDELGVISGDNYISNVKYIRIICKDAFSKKYSGIKCAYLFGSYARGEETGKSDIDILLVGFVREETLCEISNYLETRLHKKIDLYVLNQIVGDAILLEKILKDGIKIYG